MTLPSRLSADHAGPDVVRADLADLDVLSQVIADAFCELAPSRWLITDPAVRREIFPGYFRLYLEHALASGAVYTTPGRTAALWVHAGEGGAGQADGYDTRLVTVTRPWTGRFAAFDAALDQHHPADVTHHLTILAVRPDTQGRGTGSALLRPAMTCSTSRTCPPTWKPPARPAGTCTRPTATRSGRTHRSTFRRAGRRCGR